MVVALNGPDDRFRLRTDIAFLQSSVSEAIRLHPPAPLLIRQALEDITLGSGWRVAQGQSLIIDLITTSQDPSVFGDDAEHFNPHRQTAGHIHRYGLSFGLDDCAQAARSFVRAAIDCVGPFAMDRLRPDGRHLDWQFLIPAGSAWRKPWPFLIE